MDEKPITQQWSQTGFAVVSKLENYPGIPFFHAFYPSKWLADAEMQKINLHLPERLRLDLMVTPATLTFDFPNAPALPTASEGRPNT